MLFRFGLFLTFFFLLRHCFIGKLCFLRNLFMLIHLIVGRVEKGLWFLILLNFKQIFWSIPKEDDVLSSSFSSYLLFSSSSPSFWHFAFPFLSLLYFLFAMWFVNKKSVIIYTIFVLWVVYIFRNLLFIKIIILWNF